MTYGVPLQPGETIIKVFHRSYISLFPYALVSAILTFVGAELSNMITTNSTELSLGRPAVVTIVFFLFVISLIVLFAGIYVYNHNVLIFTNEHLIEVEQNGLFGRIISEVSFNREQDISGNRSGFFATIFDYGNVTVQSAGENVHFVFRYARDPEEISNEAIATNEANMGNVGQGLG